MALLTIDIGGSAVKYGIWDNGELKEKNQFPTPLIRTQFYSSLKKIKNKQSKNYSIDGLAVSCPGDVDESTGMVNGFSFVPFLHVLPFAKPLSEELGLPVSLINDANSAALAEMTYGIGQKKTHPLFVIIGTGVGVAIVENGEIITDSAEKIDQLDKRVADTIKNLNNHKVSPVHIGRRVSIKKFQMPSSIEGKDVFELAEQGDEIAQEELKQMYQSLADILLSLNLAFEPEFIGIGGGVSNNPDFVSNIRKELEKATIEQSGIVDWFKVIFTKESLDQQDIPEVKTCAYKNDANLLGAILHFEEKYVCTSAKVKN